MGMGSYLPPRHFWVSLLPVFWQCQSKAGLMEKGEANDLCSRKVSLH